MSDLYRFEEELPELHKPVLVLAFDGWIDAGGAAASAMSQLQRTAEPSLVATFDTDILLDYRARRPILHLNHGREGDLEWPSLQLFAGSDRAGNHMLLFGGPEPDHSWHRFSAEIAELALRFDAGMLIGLGAYPAPVPHTREPRMVATSPDGEWARGVGVVPGPIDVPAGVGVAVAHACHEAGLKTLSIWVQVPHYASAMPYPAAAARLVRGLCEVSGLVIESEPLDAEGELVRRRLDSAVEENDEHQSMIAELEHLYDSTDASIGFGQEGDLPTGDEIAAELQRFLRDQEAD